MNGRCSLLNAHAGPQARLLVRPMLLHVLGAHICLQMVVSPGLCATSGTRPLPPLLTGEHVVKFRQGWELVNPTDRYTQCLLTLNVSKERVSLVPTLL